MVSRRKFFLFVFFEMLILQIVNSQKQGEILVLSEPHKYSTTSIYATNSIATMKDFHIPFTLNEGAENSDTEAYTPVIKAFINQVPVNMGISMCGLDVESEIYTSFLKKLGGQNLVDSVKKTIEEKAETLYPAVELNDYIIQDIIVKHLTSCIFSSTCINNVEMGKFQASYYNAQEHLPVSTDGILGLLFFNRCQNIVLDYINNEIIINAPPLKSEEIPLTLFQDLCSFAISVSINGVKQDAIIAPTVSAVYLRDDYKNSIKYSNDEILSFVKSGNCRKPTDKYKNITVKIFNSEVKCRGYFSSRREGEMISETPNLVMRKINFLGYPVFKGRRIQLDFKNWVFRMD